jgi:hypothetical protein
VQLIKEEQAHKAENNIKNRRSGETADPGAEKSRLLSEEGNPAAEEEAGVDSGNLEDAEGSAGLETAEQRSKKAQGKMRERQSLSEDNAGVPAASVGRNGFVPAQEWVSLYTYLIIGIQIFVYAGCVMAARVSYSAKFHFDLSFMARVVYHWIVCY